MLLILSWEELTMSIGNFPFWKGANDSEALLGDIQFIFETVLIYSTNSEISCNWISTFK